MTDCIQANHKYLYNTDSQKGMNIRYLLMMSASKEPVGSCVQTDTIATTPAG